MLPVTFDGRSKTSECLPSQMSTISRDKSLKQTMKTPENTMTSEIKALTSGAVFFSHLAKSFFEIRPTPETRKREKLRREAELSAVISESGAMDIHFGPMHLKFISCWSTASKVS